MTAAHLTGDFSRVTPSCSDNLFNSLTGVKSQLEESHHEAARLSLCGIAPLNTKIVGGEDAVAGAWPWQASLHRNGRHFCGGSLINSQWILTAAHCFPSTSLANLIVYLGRETQDSVNSNEVSRSVTQIINHPDYNDNTNDNDISLLQLSSSVDFTNYIRPVCLAAAGSVFAAGTNTWVTGWGDIQSDVSLPSPGTLQEVNIPIVSTTVCSNSYTLTSNMICAGLTEGGKDSCQGDSGGPLVSKNNTQWVQAGVVSFGRGCALANTPGVYARVSQYQSWINSQITSDQPGFVVFAGSSTSSTGGAQLVSFSVPLLLSVLPVLFSLFVLS
ncbi:serine protease 27-like [Scomber japonicus]|uniref:serine protease 27-like n=1 Tax=Scomber japonicus TaxID=13676 RepID=UPI002305A203|nr:serine protease 27-like [Scomber japonicus]